jgi:hypothetical protein
MNEKAWVAKTDLEIARVQFLRGQITQDKLRQVAQAYVDAIVEFKKGNPRAKKLRIPSVTQLLR